jgi:lysozyme family protein
MQRTLFALVLLMGVTNSHAFGQAFEYVLDHEGGYVNDPVDPGGGTAFGISSKSYPNLIITDITVEDAREIYWRDWWMMYHYDRLPPRLAIKVMDTAVNVGPVRAHSWMQAGLNQTGAELEVDGVIGRMTITASHDCTDMMAVMRWVSKRQASHYRRLVKRSPKLERFIDGWMKRAKLLP